MKFIEDIAKALWQEESLRTSGRKRRIRWSEENEDEQDRFRRFARVAVDFINTPDNGAIYDAGIDRATRRGTRSS